MLGRKSYTEEELDQGRKTIDQQLGAYRKLVKELPVRNPGKALDSARGSFESRFFNNMALVLDRLFVHRLSGPEHEGKDGNPLNELRIIVDSLISHEGKMRSDKKIKLAPDQSVVGLAVGDRIELTEDQFTRLASAFFEELERRFL
jgi:hypothetical protein